MRKKRNGHASWATGKKLWGTRLCPVFTENKLIASKPDEDPSPRAISRSAANHTVWSTILGFLPKGCGKHVDPSFPDYSCSKEDDGEDSQSELAINWLPIWKSNNQNGGAAERLLFWMFLYRHCLSSHLMVHTVSREYWWKSFFLLVRGKQIKKFLISTGAAFWCC